MAPSSVLQRPCRTLLPAQDPPSLRARGSAVRRPEAALQLQRFLERLVSTTLEWRAPFRGREHPPFWGVLGGIEGFRPSGYWSRGWARPSRESRRLRRNASTMISSDVSLAYPLVLHLVE